MFDEFDRSVFAKGETVFNASDVGDCAYVVEEGVVEIYVVLENGKEHHLSTMGKGEMFGEIALIDEKPRTANVRALERAILVPIQRTLVNDLLSKSDPILRHLLMVILERFRNQIAPTAVSATPYPQSKQHTALRGQANQKLSLAHGLTRALAREEFHLYYQPICDLADNKISGFEALIRWQHPKRGLVEPMEFLALAEQTGLIRDIGLWTLERACRDWSVLRRLTKNDHPFVSVNLSACQLTTSSLVEDIKAVIEHYSMPPQELKLELTETVMVERPDEALVILNQLIGLGSSLAVDDYGTGHSGLDYLQRYPIGTMKVDRSFAAYVVKSPQSREIVRSSIALAHSLGMNVVAEGIEDEDVCAELAKLDCDFGQGWLFGKAMALEDLVKRYST